MSGDFLDILGADTQVGPQRASLAFPAKIRYFFSTIYEFSLNGYLQ
jgi:hypothetical protein